MPLRMSAAWYDALPWPLGMDAGFILKEDYDKEEVFQINFGARFWSNM